MTIYVNAPPLSFDFRISGTMPNINIDADTLTFRTGIKALFSSYPAAARNPDYDITFDCAGFDRFDEADQGVLPFSTEVSGSWLNITIHPDTLEFTPTISGICYTGTVVSAEPLAFDLAIVGEITIEPSKTAWVAWSDIGSLDFKISEDDPNNQAGERPMEWAGVIHDILKFNSSVIVYGSNGIAEMKPVQNTWSYRSVSSFGTAGRNAQVTNSDNTRHWFIDIIGQLWELSNKINRLDYSEFLSELNNPVMSINEVEEVIYICDGDTGYNYSYNNQSLGKGAGNICGYGYKNNIAYITAPEVIPTPTVEFTTNIYDGGSRKNKTVFNLEISTDVSQTMQVAIEYRTNQNADFVQSPWVNFNPNGFAELPCYGIEFRFKFRMSVYESFSIDQLKINGVIHGFSFLDTVRKEN